MKKILNILGIITLIETNLTSLIACNNKNKINESFKEELNKLKQKNKICTTDKIIKNNLEGMEPQEKPFDKVDNKGYFVVGRGLFNDKLKIDIFNNNNISIRINTTGDGLIKNGNDLQIGYGRNGKNGTNNLNYFKAVYRGNLLNKPYFNLIINNDGNIKVNK